MSGGIARSDLMCEILATVLDRPLERLQSVEGPGPGAAAVTALASLETHLRQRQGIAAPFTVADAVAVLVKFREAGGAEPGVARGVPGGATGVREGVAMTGRFSPDRGGEAIRAAP